MTLTNLRALVRYFSLGDSASTDYSDADTLRQLNSAYQQLIILAFSASGDWQFRGNNKQTTSITAGTRQYALPTTFLRINRVEIKYPSSATDYYPAKPIDYKLIDANGLDDYTTSSPQFDIVEDKLEIFVSNKTANITAVTSGILIYYDDEITELATADNEPDIPEPFSRLMALMAAKDYCGVNNMSERLSWIEKEIAKEEIKFVEFLSNRNEAKRLSIRFKEEDYTCGEEESSVNFNDPT